MSTFLLLRQLSFASISPPSAMRIEGYASTCLKEISNGMV